jgi:putative phage-type endonuclease
MQGMQSSINVEAEADRVLQGTPEWHQCRLGKLTASRIADATAKTKTGYGASRANLMAALICERLTGMPQETYSNSAMEWGAAQEATARELYEFMRDVEVEQVGFVDHPTIAMSGASPDGRIGRDGLIEIKAPNSSTHIQTLLSETIDGKYIKQIQWQLACEGRAWCDFVSFDPRLGSDLQIWIKRVHRDDGLIHELESEAVKFLAEIDQTIAKLQAKFMRAAA